jgi:hypothetical protein
VGSSELEGGGWREVAIPVTSLGEGNTYTSHYTIRQHLYLITFTDNVLTFN